MAGKAFREYLELFEYFGRGGLPKLNGEEFDALDREFNQLLAIEEPWHIDQARRVMELKALLLCDRPLKREIIRRTRKDD